MKCITSIMKNVRYLRDDALVILGATLAAGFVSAVQAAFEAEAKSNVDPDQASAEVMGEQSKAACPLDWPLPPSDELHRVRELLRAERRAHAESRKQIKALERDRDAGRWRASQAVTVDLGAGLKDWVIRDPRSRFTKLHEQDEPEADNIGTLWARDADGLWWRVTCVRGEPRSAYHPLHGRRPAFRDTFGVWHAELGSEKDKDGICRGGNRPAYIDQVSGAAASEHVAPDDDEPSVSDQEIAQAMNHVREDDATTRAMREMIAKSPRVEFKHPLPDGVRFDPEHCVLIDEQHRVGDPLYMGGRYLQFQLIMRLDEAQEAFRKALHEHFDRCLKLCGDDWGWSVDDGRSNCPPRHGSWQLTFSRSDHGTPRDVGVLHATFGAEHSTPIWFVPLGGVPEAIRLLAFHIFEMEFSHG